MELNREKINLAMARKGYTIAQLAEAYGVSPQRIYIILGQKKVSPAAAGRLAAALGVDVTEILEGVETPAKAPEKKFDLFEKF